MVLEWNGAEWEVVQRRSVRIALRLAIPSRSRRHRQAAIHALWHTGQEKEMVFYGFRRRDDGWTCTACERNVVKDRWFECQVCGAELPQAWNFG
jgi:hypothetical protein